MNEHTKVERKLKTEIHYKNTLFRDLFAGVHLLHEWQTRLAGLKNIRKEKKLRGSIERHIEFLDNLSNYLAANLDDIEKSIKEEIKFSEKEVEEFHKELDADKKLAEAARVAFVKTKTNAATEDKDKLEPEELAALHAEYSKTWKAFRLQKHKLDVVKEELKSEEQDKVIFSQELKRIIVERHFLAEL